MIQGRFSDFLLRISLGVAAAAVIRTGEGIALAEAGEIPEISVTAPRDGFIPEGTAPLYSVPPETIAAFQTETLGDIINRSTPAFVENSASGEFIYLRGAEPNYTSVFIDGVPLNDPTNSRGGSVDLGAFSPADIERVEILSATDAARLGPGELGGAVNLVTRRVRSQSSGAAGGLGTAGSASGAGRLIHSSDDWGVSMAGHSMDFGETLQDNSRRLAGGSLRGEYDVSPEIDLTLTARADHSEQLSFPEDSGGPEYAAQDLRTNRSQNQGVASARLEGKLAESADFFGQYSHFYTGSTEAAPGVLPGQRDPFGIPPTGADARLNRDLVQSRFRFSPDGGTMILASAEGSQERARSNGEIDIGEGEIPADFRADRYALGGYVEAARSFAALNLRAGARYDQFQGVNGQFEPVTKASYDFAPFATGWVGYSEATKPPSIYALSHPVVGNPDLRPERGRTLEGGIKGSHNRWSYSATVFKSAFLDAIDFDEGPPPRLVNRDKITSDGAEGLLSIPIGESASCTGSIAYVNSSVEGSDQNLRYRPRWRSAAGCTARLDEHWEIGAGMNSASSVHDSSIPTGDTNLAPYLLSDLFAAWRPGSHLTARMLVDNLGNDRHEVRVGTRSAGIGARLILEYEY